MSLAKKYRAQLRYTDKENLAVLSQKKVAGTFWLGFKRFARFDDAIYIIPATPEAYNAQKEAIANLFDCSDPDCMAEDALAALGITRPATKERRERT